MRSNEPFTKNKFSRAIDEFKVKGNYQGEWSIMDLRHSFAVNYLTHGGDIKDLQYILRQSKLQDTRRLYGEIVTQRFTQNFENPNDMESETTAL